MTVYRSTLSLYSIPVLLIVIHLTCVSSDDDREQVAAIGIHEDEKIPVSEHEFPTENIPTRPNYRGAGHWATPAPNSGIELGFVPIKMYAQVRRSHTVKHLPRSDALASATTAEEVANAPRLREVVSTKKISEVYSEEGYEDSAYDHGGFAKEAENHEGYDHRDGKKRKPKSKKQKYVNAEDSESQGTQEQAKQVGTTGEQLSNKDPHHLNTWKSHKVMTNETRLMFVDNQGENGLPMKLMASYSHTIQHPGGTTTHSHQNPTTTINVASLGTGENPTTHWKPIQQELPSNINPEAFKLAEVSTESNTEAMSLPKEKQTLPIFYIPEGETRTQQNKNNTAHLANSNIEVAPTTFWKPIQQEFSTKINPQAFRLEEVSTKTSEEVKEQQIFPTFPTTPEVEQYQDGSMNSYEQLREKLYGSPLKKFDAIAADNIFRRKYSHIPVPRKQINHQKKELAEDSLNTSSSGSTLTLRRTEPESGDIGSTLLNEGKGINHLLNSPTRPWDSVYQRKHPSIPLEEITNVQRQNIPLTLMKNDPSIPVEIVVTSTQPSRSMFTRKQAIREFFQQPLPQQRIDALPSVGIVMVSNKTKHAEKYTSKYKDISKFRNLGELLNSTYVETLQLPKAKNDNVSTFIKDLDNPYNSPNEKKIKSVSVSFPNTEDPLPLWAKFIEALTLAQYSKKGKTFQDPRQEIRVDAIIPTQRTKSLTNMPLLTKEPFIRKDQGMQIDYKNIKLLRKIESQEYIPTTVPSSNSEFIPYKEISKNINITQVTPTTIIVDVKPTETLNSENETINNAFMEQNTSESEQQYRSLKPEKNLESKQGAQLRSNEEEQTASRRIDGDDYGTPQYLSGEDEELRLEEEERLLEEEKDRELQKNVNEWKEALQNAEKGVSTVPRVNTKKYPFYKSPPTSALSLHSPLRYATNPKTIPLKTEGGMEFYESRENIYCPEVTGPTEVVPKRTNAGEWNKNPKARLPRLRGLGDKIDCMRTKYFGSDPLDNPFFKEEVVALPRQASSVKVETAEDEDALGFYADIMEHIRNIGDANNMPLYSKPAPEQTRLTSSKQQMKHVSEPDEYDTEEGNRHFVPIIGQYNLETASSLRSHKKPVDVSEYAGYQTHVDLEETRHSQDQYETLPGHKYRNITHDSIQNSPGLLTRDPEHNHNPSGSFKDSNSFSLSENGNLVPTLTEDTTANAYRSPHSDVILGMVPPPKPTPSYLIIKTVTHTPKIYPTSILSVLEETPVTIRPRKRPISLYNYRNIPGLMPPSIQQFRNGNDYVVENELAATNAVRGNQRGQFSRNPKNGHTNSNVGNSEVESNADVMVAEETSKPEITTTFKHEPTRKEEDIVSTRGTHHRERRRAIKYNRRNYDTIDEDDSTLKDNKSRNQHRRTDTTRFKKGEKSLKIGNVRKQTGRTRNSLDNKRRRMDHEDEFEYQSYDEDVLHTPDMNKFRKKYTRRRESEEAYDDVPEYSDYAATVEYDITHDSEEPVPQVNTYRATKEESKKSGKYSESIPLERSAGSDSRRSEPRYNDKEETNTRNLRVNSRSRSNRNRSGSAVSENTQNKPKKSESRQNDRKESPKKTVTRLNRKQNTNAFCGESRTDDGCLESQTEPANISPEESYDYSTLPQTEDTTVDVETETVKHSSKLNAKGFKSLQENSKEANITLDETTEKSDPVKKFKSKYSEGVMSAEQINRILGGFMSRHNPSYSSKYKAEETTISPTTTNSTPDTSMVTPITTTTSATAKPITKNAEAKSSRSGTKHSTSSKSKDFQKARIIPILNARVLPELVTSTTKPPDNNTNRRKPSSGRFTKPSSGRQESSTQTPKPNRGKHLRLKQDTRQEDKQGKSEDQRSNKKETPENLTPNVTYSESRDKVNSTRRRNTGSRVTVKKPKIETEGTEKTTDATSANRGRIPIRITNPETDTSSTNKDGVRSNKNWRLRRKGRENNVNEEPNSSQEANKNSTGVILQDLPENATTPASRRLQAVEHRRVTKEEIFTTTYFPEEELAREMERQSELDAAELEGADESREKVIRNASEEEYEDEDDEEEDIYEPYESYNYESKHLKYPGNRLQLEGKLQSDDNWNAKRGYYIVHEPDSAPNDFQQSHNFKENARTQTLKNNYSNYRKHNRQKESDTPKIDNSKYSDTNSNKDEESKGESSVKTVTKNGIKGFYIQRSLETTTQKPHSNRGDRNNEGDKVLTYIVDRHTGIGEWVPTFDDSIGNGKENDKAEQKQEGDNYDLEEPSWTSVRESSKQPSTWRKKPRVSAERGNNSDYQEDQEEKAKETKSDNVTTGDAKRSGKAKNVKDKLEKKKQWDNIEEDIAKDSSVINSNDRGSRTDSVKGSTQNKSRNNSGRPKVNKDSPEHVKDNINAKAKNDKVKSSAKLRGNKEERKQRYNQEDDDLKDTVRVPNSGKHSHRRNKGRQFKNQRNQFKDTDTNIRPSGSEIVYYEEEVPDDTKYYKEKQEQDTEDYETEKSNEKEREDLEENYKEAIADIYGKILSDIGPTLGITYESGHQREYGPKERENGNEDASNINRFVKHPGERHYYYVDDDAHDDERKRIQQNRRISTNDNHKIKYVTSDETLED